MSNTILPTTYYHRRKNGTHAVICPICGAVHIYNHTGVAICYEHVESKFSVIEPLNSWQYEHAQMAKLAAEALEI